MTGSWSAVSPFVFDGPVAPAAVIGRDYEAARLREWARAGRFVALTAPRRFGKTSLINKVAVDADADDETAVITVDLYDVASVADLVIRLERAWAVHTPTRLRRAVGRALSGTEVGLSIAGTGFTVKLAERPQTDPLPALHVLLDLPQQVAGTRHHARTLVVFDEFQALHAISGVEGVIRSHAQHQREVASYIFAGSEPGMIAAAFTDRARPFYGQVEQFSLGPLPRRAVVDHVIAQSARSGRDVSGVVGALYDFSQGHPQRTMLLAHLLWVGIRPDSTATGEDLAAAVDAALRRVDPEARAVMDSLDQGARKTLRAVAEHATPLSARAGRTLDLPKGTAQHAATRLLAGAHIERHDGAYRLVDPLLAEWIRRTLGTRAVATPNS